MVTSSDLRRYISSKGNSWSATTLKSEEARLRSVLPLLNSSPAKLWTHLQNMKPYTRCTVWSRVSCFWSFIFPGLRNPYSDFRQVNANFFKSAYIPERLTVSFDEAKRRIEKVEREDVRTLALDILHSGVRYFESLQPKGTGVIVGKGNKPRQDLRPPGPIIFSASYSTFWRQLKELTGLKPHSLRKLALTRAAEMGAQSQDLLEISGWSSIATAALYLQPKQNEKLKGMMR